MLRTLRDLERPQTAGQASGGWDMSFRQTSMARSFGASDPGIAIEIVERGNGKSIRMPPSSLTAQQWVSFRILTAE